MQGNGKLPVEGIKFETIAMIVPDAIVISDQFDNVLFANQKTIEIFGYSEAEIEQLKVACLMPEHYRNLHKAGIKRLLDTLQPHLIGKIIEVEGLRKNGNVFPLELSLTWWKEDDLFYFLAIMRDISERKQTMSQLADSREEFRKINIGLEDRVNRRTEELHNKQRQLELITDSIPVLVSYINPDYIYTFGNKLYSNLKNSPDSIVGQPVEKILGEDAFRVSGPYLARAMQGERVVFQNKIKFKGGEEKLIELNFVPDISEEGIVRGLVVLGIDLTDRIRYEQELKETNEQLNKINEELDNFVYAASHDLKAPVSNIEGLVETLGEDLKQAGTSKETEDLTALLKISVTRLRKILEELAGISRIKKGVSVDFEQVNVKKLVEEIEETIKPEIDKAEAEVQLDVKADQIPFSVSGLRSILYNLISNAIKYRMPGKKPLVKILIEKVPGYFLIRIADNGLGINKENQDKIFGMFKRMHSHVEGSGVGLYLVKRLIDNAGGKILLESEENKGSVFSVYLPATT